MLALHVTRGAVAHAGAIDANYAPDARQLARVLVRGRVQAADAEAGHGAGERQVGGDPEGAGVGVVNVQVFARETRLNHRLQAVHEQLCVILVLRRLGKQTQNHD